MERVHTHYDNLKVTRNAPLEVIKAAYRAMAQKYHPDLNSSPDAVRVMKIVNEAWYVLSDPNRRAEHDKSIVEHETASKPKVSPQPSKEYSFKAGGSEFVYQRENTGFAGRKSATNPTQNKGGSSSGAQTSTDYGSFSDATEGYKAATPDWLRSLNHAIVNLNRKLGTSKAQVYSVFLLAMVLVVGIVTLSVVSHRTNTPTEILSADDFLSGKERTDSFVSGAPSVSTSTNPKSNLVAGNRTQSATAPPTFSFEEARVNPAEVNRTQITPGFRPFDGVLDAPRTDDKFETADKLAKGRESEEVRPKNGYLKGERQNFSGGLSTFKIDNSNGSHDAEVRLYLSGMQIRGMFVRVGTTFTAEKLGPGTYKMRYKMNINGKPHAFQAKEDFVLTQTVTETGTGTSTRFSRMTVTLYKVRDGNMQVEEIPLDKF